MPTATLSDGALLDADGNVVGFVHASELVARVTACAFGTVFQSGLGGGEIRQSLLAAVAAETLTLAFCQEESPDVISYYGDLFPEDIEVIESDALTALENQITPPDPEAPFFPWSMGIFDFSVVDLASDEDFTDSLKALWPTVGGRVVVIAQRADLTLPGFVSPGPETFATGYLYLFDRFDPGDDIGEANPHGSNYLPGYGWQE